MSKRADFGTDGIRGQANRYPMTAEVALRVGMAAGKLFRSGGDRRHLVVIGKDTRLSGYMIEPALVAGFTSVGMDVRLFGPLPTPQWFTAAWKVVVPVPVKIERFGVPPVP